MSGVNLKCNQIWEITDPYLTGPLIVTSHPQLSNEVNNALIQGKLRPKEPITFRHVLGRTPRDLLATTLPGRYLLSDRIVSAMKDAKFTGWTTYPVKITRKRGEDIHGYHGFSVTGRCNPLDWPKSLNQSRSSPHWDGSDIFLVQERDLIGITERVYSVLKALHPSNMEFVRADHAAIKAFSGRCFLEFKSEYVKA